MATDVLLSSVSARKTRVAISPRLATITLEMWTILDKVILHGRLNLLDNSLVEAVKNK